MEKIWFLFDYCADSCLWGTETGLLPLERFPISNELKTALLALCREYDTCLNWNDPASGLVWTEEQSESFHRRAQAAYDALVKELGSAWEIENKI